jgi:hypothetical protein
MTLATGVKAPVRMPGHRVIVGMMSTQGQLLLLSAVPGDYRLGFLKNLGKSIDSFCFNRLFTSLTNLMKTRPNLFDENQL